MCFRVLYGDVHMGIPRYTNGATIYPTMPTAAPSSNDSDGGDDGCFVHVLLRFLRTLRVMSATGFVSVTELLTSALAILRTNVATQTARIAHSVSSRSSASNSATTRPRTTTNAPPSRPWCGGAVDERIPVPNVGRLSLPEHNERRAQIHAQTMQRTPGERYAHAYRARERVRVTAERIREAAASHIEHEDPPMYACSCGLCPDDTAAYAMCAASTIRRTIRSFGSRATTSVASLAIRHQSQCSMMVWRASSALSPARSW